MLLLQISPTHTLTSEAISRRSYCWAKFKSLSLKTPELCLWIFFTPPPPFFFFLMVLPIKSGFPSNCNHHYSNCEIWLPRQTKLSEKREAHSSLVFVPFCFSSLLFHSMAVVRGLLGSSLLLKWLLSMRLAGSQSSMFCTAEEAELLVPRLEPRT